MNYKQSDRHAWPSSRSSRAAPVAVPRPVALPATLATTNSRGREKAKKKKKKRFTKSKSKKRKKKGKTNVHVLGRAAQEEDMRASMLAQVLSPEARERLSRIRIVRAERARR